MKALVTIGFAALTLISSSAGALTVIQDFDSFTSPPVTGYYIDSGVGPTVITPELTVSSGDSARVMNSTGWASMQTSGDNLYGTLDGYINLNFSSPVTNLSFDLINGTDAGKFSVSFFDIFTNLLFTDTFNLEEYTFPGSVTHIAPGVSGIARVEIDAYGDITDIAIDTIRFDVSSVPEPGSLALIGLALAGLAGLRRRV